VQGRDKAYGPNRSFSAMVLQKHEGNGRTLTRRDRHASVVTVPAYFMTRSARRPRTAGRIAGLGSPWHHQRTEPQPRSPTGSTRALAPRRSPIYDLGGGTFDIPCSNWATACSKCALTNGDTFLGRRRFRFAPAELPSADESKKRSRSISGKTSSALQRLKEEAEKAKKELSTAQQYDVNLPFITGRTRRARQHLNLKITRAKYESLVEDLIQKTLAPCKAAAGRTRASMPARFKKSFSSAA